MTKLKFFSQWQNPPHSTPQKMDHTRHVSLTGYVPLEQRIQEMMQAGVRLATMRHGGVYDTDFYGEINPEEIPVDPTRQGLDPAELTEMATGVKSRIDEQIVNARKLAAEAKKKAAVAASAEKPKDTPAA